MANDPMIGRSFVNLKFIKKLMNFGEELLSNEARKVSDNLYLAANQLDKGTTRPPAISLSLFKIYWMNHWK